MKAPLIILGACIVVLCVASSVIFVEAFQSKRNLRQASQKMEADLRAARTTADALLAEKQEMARQLQVFQELTENLQSQITDLSTDTPSESGSEGNPPIVAPYQAQAYLGKLPLGWVWIIPQNLHKDTNTQRYVYQPVVWLDESLRKQFVTHHTNVVEREIATQSYFNTTYYPEPVYYYSTPIHRPHPIPTNCPPVPPLPPTPIQPVAKPFKAGPGGIAVQRLGTPAGAIKTRPAP